MGAINFSGQSGTPRKPYVGRDGSVSPLSQLKSRPPADRDWALSLAATLSSKDAIIEIKNRLGIDLKWETCYSRFIRWQQQQDRIADYLESIQQRLQIAELGNRQSAEANRSSHAALLMDEAARNLDGKTFAGIARISLSESRLAQMAKKIDISQQRVDILRKRLEWEIKQQKQPSAAAVQRNHESEFLSYDEREQAVNEILGITEAAATNTNERK